MANLPKVENHRFSFTRILLVEILAKVLERQHGGVRFRRPRNETKRNEQERKRAMDGKQEPCAASSTARGQLELQIERNDSVGG